MKFILLISVILTIDTFYLKTILPRREKTKYTFRNSSGDRMIVIDTNLRGFNTKFIIKEIQ